MAETTTVTFDRIGRNHEPPPVTVASTDPDTVAAAVFAHARPYLMSRDIDVVVDGDRVTIFAGIQVGGTGTLTVVCECEHPHALCIPDCHSEPSR